MGQVRVQEACRDSRKPRGTDDDDDGTFVVMLLMASASAVVWQADCPCTIFFAANIVFP